MQAPSEASWRGITSAIRRTRAWRFAAGFWAEDVAERDGRRSWRPPSAILARRPYLAAERLVQARRTG